MINLILQNLKEIKKIDNSKLIIYFGISVFIYYFLEKIEIRKIVLIIVIFCCVFFYYTNDKTSNKPFNNNSEASNKLEAKIQQLKNTNPQLKENVNIEKLNQDIKKIETFIKVNIKEQIPTSSSFLNKTKNPNIQTTYTELLELLDIYLKEVEAILEIREYKHKNYEKLLDIKKEININISSLFFRLSMNKDKEISTLINTINHTFKNIEEFLKEFINNEFKEKPHHLGGLVNEEVNPPRSYDITQDKDCYIVEF